MNVTPKVLKTTLLMTSTMCMVGVTGLPTAQAAFEWTPPSNVTQTPSEQPTPQPAIPAPSDDPLLTPEVPAAPPQPVEQAPQTEVQPVMPFEVDETEAVAVPPEAAPAPENPGLGLSPAASAAENDMPQPPAAIMKAPVSPEPDDEIEAVVTPAPELQSFEESVSPAAPPSPSRPSPAEAVTEEPVIETQEPSASPQPVSSQPRRPQIQPVVSETQRPEAPAVPRRDGSNVFEGFGNDLPLIMAVRQIVPSSYSYSFDDGVDLSSRVSWEGGQSWQDTLRGVAGDLGYRAEFSGNTVVLTNGAVQQTSEEFAPVQPSAPAQSAEPVPMPQSSGETATTPMPLTAETEPARATEPASNAMAVEEETLPATISAPQTEVRRQPVQEEGEGMRSSREMSDVLNSLEEIAEEAESKIQRPEPRKPVVRPAPDPEAKNVPTQDRQSSVQDRSSMEDMQAGGSAALSQTLTETSDNMPASVSAEMETEVDATETQIQTETMMPEDAPAEIAVSAQPVENEEPSALDMRKDNTTNQALERNLSDILAQEGGRYDDPASFSDVSRAPKQNAMSGQAGNISSSSETSGNRPQVAALNINAGNSATSPAPAPEADGQTSPREMITGVADEAEPITPSQPQISETQMASPEAVIGEEPREMLTESTNIGENTRPSETQLPEPSEITKDVVEEGAPPRQTLTETAEAPVDAPQESEPIMLQASSSNDMSGEAQNDMPVQVMEAPTPDMQEELEVASLPEPAAMQPVDSTDNPRQGIIPPAVEPQEENDSAQMQAPQQPVNPAYGDVSVWKVKKGADLKNTLNQWADQANVNLDWQMDSDVDVGYMVWVEGTFAEAVTTLNQGYENSQGARPMITFVPDHQNGPTLEVRSAI